MKRSACAIGGVAILAAVLFPAAAQAGTACDDLGGTLGAQQICHSETATDAYAVELEFPTDYPDHQRIADYLLALRGDFVAFAEAAPGRDRPYSLTATASSYRAGDDGSGTHSVVLQMAQDADPHPVTFFKAFNTDLATGTPITLTTLFAPGTDPLDVVFPAVRRELEKRWQPAVLAEMLGDESLIDEHTFANFALTDDALVFYFGQGQLLGHPEGPIQVSVPRSGLASLRGQSGQSETASWSTAPR